MRKTMAGVAVAVTVGAGLLAAPVTTAGAAPRTTGGGTPAEYVVLYKAGTNAASARAAIRQAGGQVLSENTKLGYALVRSSAAGFQDRAGSSAVLEGAARNRPIGYAPAAQRARTSDIERLTAERQGASAAGRSRAVQQSGPTAEPLADRQWDMRQIGATPRGSYRVQRGSHRVMVGVIDTGVWGIHPDIHANFDAKASRNFTKDIPAVDGPCEFKGCKDPANWDDNGHGTHVASTIGSPINGIGIAGVAPNVTLVNIRAGQDSGYFFLQPTLDALTYAGDIGVDVVNMSFFTDPWLFNCLHNPKDSSREQREQRVIREATQRAMSYAVNHGVAPVAAEGNEATDLGHPTVDTTSPDYPPGTEKTRRVTNNCITVPTETKGVTAVAATGVSTRKAYFSNYGTEQTDVAAPGGDYYDSPDNTGDPRNIVLAAYPKRLARLAGEIDSHGRPTTPFVVRDCENGRCAYYQYLQGTSMASPHAAGVAGLIVSEFGHADPAHSGGWTLDASRTRRLLLASAAERACPKPRQYHYKLVASDGSVARLSAYCAGPLANNGFYGKGIVNAFSAVTYGS